MKYHIDSKQAESAYKRWYAILWPIKRSELPKFCSMAALMFLILLNQNLIRGIKDALVVTLIGAEVLGFIKLFVEIPAGILFVMVYTILCNKMTTESVFRLVMIFFVLYFSLFIFLFFPYQELFHPNSSTIADYVACYPHLKWFFLMWSKWTLVLFYMMGELWPMVIFTLLYWQFANKIITIEESGRFYFYLHLVGQANMLVSGSILAYFYSNNHFLFSLLSRYKSGIELKVASLIVVALCLCILILFLHRYIEKYIICSKTVQGAIMEGGLALGLWESAKMIMGSKYLFLISILMVSYSTVLNLIEALWFHQTRLFYGNDPSYFIAYHGKVLCWTGVTTLTCALLGNALMRKMGWRRLALVTPIVTIVSGGLFFFFVVAKHFDFLPETIGGISILALIVVMGAVQSVLGKGVKYCLGDVTKEMAYMPLNKEMATKGKAAVDILGGKIGKASGALLHVICYTIAPTMRPDQLAPFLMVMFFLICIIWIIAVNRLSKQYGKLVQER